MEQQIFCVLLDWMVATPARSMYVHVPRWQLCNMAWHYLDVSTVAWSPSRPSAVRLALRFFLLGARSDLEELREQTWTQERRVFRAIQRSGVSIDRQDSIVDSVRQLAVEYRVERTVSIYARREFIGRPVTREGATRLHRLTRDALRQDVDSVSSEEVQDSEASEEVSEDEA